MSHETLDSHIEITPGVLGGKARIAGRRISVAHIATLHERLGQSADVIAAEFELTLADVHAALAYYFDHRAEIDAETARGDQLVEELRRQFPSLLAAKLAATAGNGQHD